MAGTVNLDALIEREDFQVTGNMPVDQNRPGNELYLNTLTSEGRLASLRKPEFQRETSAWKPEIIANFIKSVVDGDVIPAVIMWRSPTTGKIFVIDGAHRLSALIAWIHDDYGDGTISQKFFNYQIEPSQLREAKKTRELIQSEVGAYGKLRGYAKVPETAPDDRTLKRSMRISNDPIYLQWVHGDALAAEASFIRINSTAVAIDATEKELIASRRKPNGLAARALMRAGTGHEYWSAFDDVTKNTIRETAKTIYEQLIRPIVDFPIVTLDLPAENRGYSASSVKTVLDLVTYLNPRPTGSKADDVDDDADGSATISCLEKVKKATERVFGRSSSGSLAFHPGIYCYGATAKFVPKAFIGAVGFASELQRRNKFFQFTEHRAQFEDFLLEHRSFVHQIGATQGSGGRRGIPSLIRLYMLIFEKLASGADESQILKAIESDEALSFLSVVPDQRGKGARRFSRETKAVALLRDSLSTELRCAICHARLYRKAISPDHKIRLQDGGPSTADNLEWTHPYCNSGYKEALVAATRRAAS